MPVMDGIKATQAIRAYENENPQAKKVKIIALTANALKGEREKLIETGMDEYLSKPFKTNELLEIITSITD